MNYWAVLDGGIYHPFEDYEYKLIFLYFKTGENKSLADNIEAFFSTKKQMPQVVVDWIWANRDKYDYAIYLGGYDREFKTSDRKEIIKKRALVGKNNVEVTYVPYDPEDELLSEFYKIVTPPGEMIKSVDKTASALLKQSHGDIEAAAQALASKMNDVKASPWISNKKLKDLKQSVSRAEKLRADDADRWSKWGKGLVSLQETVNQQTQDEWEERYQSIVKSNEKYYERSLKDQSRIAKLAKDNLALVKDIQTLESFIEEDMDVINELQKEKRDLQARIEMLED